MAPLEQLKPLIESLAAEMGLELFDARFFGSGKRSVLRLTIDKRGGVAIADCERVSGAVGALLDERNFFGGRPYTLEVSSPGVDRPLKTERDFLRIVGREAALHLSVAVNGKKSLRGVVAGCSGGTLVIDIGSEPVRVPLADIVSGREEIRFK
ncbi:MAG: ribosome maturation factor RimP [Chitinispirillales bacterium]|jgi:ribosome maturation factor RimP|nr:ribosome maturation factor RimP [Chitinispirillales bacterium]